MKTVELKKVPFELQGNKDVFDYKVVLMMLLETPEDPEKGATITEVRKSIRLLDALEASGETANIEDADFAYLLQRVRNMRFVASHPVFVGFVDDIENAGKE